MQVTNISQFRKNLSSYLSSVSDENDVVIVSGNGKTGVFISLENYNSFDETSYLMSNEANKKMMYKAKDEIEKGKIISKSTDQLTKMILDTKSNIDSTKKKSHKTTLKSS